MSNLGILYYNAQGVKRDLVQADVWFHRALKYGDPRGVELIGAAENKMRKKDLNRAKQMAATWTPPAQRTVLRAESGRLFMPPPATVRATTAPSSSPAQSADRGGADPAKKDQ